MSRSGADMGIQDRDYYREGPSFLDRVSAQGATVWLIAVTCGVFFGQMLTGVMRSPLTDLGAFNTERILDGEVWRLVTSVFLHGGIFHIIFNMFVLYFAGQRLEAEYGSREFVLVYLSGGVFANLFRLCAQVAGLAAPSVAVGASGAISALLIVYAFHWPHQRVLFFFVIPMPVWLLAVLYVGLDALGALQVEVVRGNRAPVGHLAHLGGAFFGLLYYQSGFEFRKLFARRPRARVRPKLRVITPPVEEERPEPVGAPVQAAPRANEAADEQLEAKLDAVLEKVSKYGQESLTPEEREILFRASELYKKRRK
ncbi:MAG: rhomboid family intramembrane serine protease [Planctomycetes bacterium]|nr:rhomboid family intramembrane serine protease [Planctomycetota bacterium]